MKAYIEVIRIKSDPKDKMTSGEKNDKSKSIK